jgi:hypothetical protein
MPQPRKKMSRKMKHLRSHAIIWFASLSFAAMFSANAATLPAEWQHQQEFNVSAPGLVKLSLPVETLDFARPLLEDLRVYDDSGSEVPYLIEHPAPAGRVVRNAKSFQTSLNAQTTVITLETGLGQPVDDITLETPARDFIKSVQVEGSSDGQNWRSVLQGKAIFRQANGASLLDLEIPPATWPWLRLTVDDQRSQPIPFTGAHVRGASGESAPNEDVPVTIADRQESPGETRLTLKLPAANLNLSDIQIDSPESLFTRQVTLTVPQIAEDTIREQPVGNGVIYRLTIEDKAASVDLSVPLETQVRSRELLLLIRNYDSPPLQVTAVHAQRRPVYLVFLAKQAGAHYLLTGNARCAAPRYDLAAFGTNLKTVAVAPVKFSTVAENPAYRPPEVLPDVQDNGVALDVSAWKFRKPVKITREGAQQLELDVDVLSHAQRDFEDVRLMRDGKQVPYILERTSISRGITPSITATNDAKNPKTSLWIIKLPRAGLPVTRLVCERGTAVFQRDMFLYEEAADERGEKYRRILNQSTWTQTPDHIGKEFGLSLETPPQSDTLFLETQNGDNPPINLEKFTVFYPATRVLFKAKSSDEPFLYYGNPDVMSPHYDLSLVANELLAADKATVALGVEEQLKKSSWRENQTAGKGGVVFWGILALVVVVLLIVISRLLPKSDSQPPK